jgi:hypothetical protein
LLQGSIQEILSEVERDLDASADRRLHESWLSAKAGITDELGSSPTLPTPIFSEGYLRENRLGPEFVNDIHPPGVFRAIRGRVDHEFAEFLEELQEPFRENEYDEERLQIVCLFLVLLGFSGDRRVAKNDRKQSEDGAESQFRDMEHVCAACTCGIFPTADHRCAKVAFTAYEALKIRTEVVFCELVAGRAELHVFGQDFWPQGRRVGCRPSVGVRARTLPTPPAPMAEAIASATRRRLPPHRPGRPCVPGRACLLGSEKMRIRPPLHVFPPAPTLTLPHEGAGKRSCADSGTDRPGRRASLPPRGGGKGWGASTINQFPSRHRHGAKPYANHTGPVRPGARG